ncbi:MAG: hypothetical protein ACTSRP_22990, partial [Candidatus Helarchaeota archaeon]
MKFQKKTIIFVFIIISLIMPFILLNSQYIINQSNKNLDYQSRITNSTVDTILRNNFTGSYNKTKVIQYAQRIFNKNDYTILNNKLRNSSDENSGVSEFNDEFNITLPQDYNISKWIIQINNITSKPSWKDIEQNISQSSTTNFGTDYNILAGAMSFNITEQTRVVKVAIYSDVLLNEDQNFTVGIYNRENQWTGKPDKKLEEHTYTGGYSWQWREYTFNLNLTPGSYFVVVNATYISGSGRRFNWSTIADSSDSDGKEGDMWYYFLGNWVESTNNDLSLKIQTELIDTNNNTLQNMNPSALNLNITCNGDKKSVPDNGTVIFSNYNENSNISVLIQSNSSFLANLTWKAWYFNETYTTNTFYFGKMNNANTTWNFNFTVNFPSNTYNYSFKINKLIPQWKLIHAYNDTT